MNKKISSSEQLSPWIATAAFIAIGAILSFLEGKRKNKSSSQSQSQAKIAENTSPVSVTPQSTPTDTQSEAATETEIDTPAKIDVSPSSTYYRNDSNPYSRPTKIVTTYDELLRGNRVMDLPTNSNYDPFGGLSDWREELADDR